MGERLPYDWGKNKDTTWATTVPIFIGGKFGALKNISPVCIASSTTTLSSPFVFVCNTCSLAVLCYRERQNEALLLLFLGNFGN